MTQQELILEIEEELPEIEIEDIEERPFIQECGTDIDNDLPEIEDEEKEVEDNPYIIYCYE